MNNSGVMGRSVSRRDQLGVGEGDRAIEQGEQPVGYADAKDPCTNNKDVDVGNLGQPRMVLAARRLGVALDAF